MWTKSVSFIEHLASIEMNKKVLKCQKVSSRKVFRSVSFSVNNKITTDFSFTSINLFQPKNHTIDEVDSYSGCQKSLQENNKTHGKSVLLGSLT